MANRKLFVSFTAALRHIKSGYITTEDLQTGLFYFGCTRSHAFEPGSQGESNELEWFFKDKTEAFSVHQVLIMFLERAEQDGRCIWRQASEMNSYEALNDLLVRNGYSYDRGDGPAIIHEPDNRMENPWYAYCYPGVRDRVQEAAIPLEVVM